MSVKSKIYTVRDSSGRMVTKISKEMLLDMLNRYSDDFTLNSNKTKYVYNGTGFSASQAFFIKVFMWKGYTISLLD